jgi:hypothetical protein
MPRMRRALLIAAALSIAACGRGEKGAEDARPPAGAPADAEPWQPRDTVPGDRAPVPR